MYDGHKGTRLQQAAIFKKKNLHLMEESMGTHQVAMTTEPRLQPVQALNRLADLTTGFCAAQAFRAAWKFGLFEEMSERLPPKSWRGGSTSIPSAAVDC